MKKEELAAIGLTDEQQEKVFALNGADIAREQAKAERAKEDLKEARAQLEKRDKDLEELKKNAGDAEGSKKALEELQAKYDADTKALNDKLADRDYADAVTAALAGEKVSFTSKGAEKSIRDSLMSDRLTLKDGKLEGFSDRLKSLRDADPEAFAAEKPAPRFSAPVGYGGQNVAIKSNAEKAAESLNKSAAAAAKSSSDIIKMYTERS